MQLSTLDTIVSSSIRSNAVIIANGIKSIPTVTIVTASGLIPLVDKTIAPSAITWLNSLGNISLAGWLAEEVRGNLTLNTNSTAEKNLLEHLSRNLQRELRKNNSIANDMANVLERTRAISIMIGALTEQSERQIRFIRMLLEDLQHNSILNERLQHVTQSALLEQEEEQRNNIAKYDPSLSIEIRALRPRDEIQRDRLIDNQMGMNKVKANNVTIGGSSIGGNVGVSQNITVTNGTIGGPIIGSQTTHYGKLTSASDALSPSITQEDIDEQEELLEAHRRTLAVYLRRLAKLGDTYAPPEVFHGIRDARAGIQHTKSTLRGWSVAVEDHPNDEE